MFWPVIPANLPVRYYLLRLGVPLDVFEGRGDGDVYVVVQLPRDTFDKVVHGAGLDLQQGGLSGSDLSPGIAVHPQVPAGLSQAPTPFLLQTGEFAQ